MNSVALMRSYLKSTLQPLFNSLDLNESSENTGSICNHSFRI